MSVFIIKLLIKFTREIFYVTVNYVASFGNLRHQSTHTCVERACWEIKIEKKITFTHNCMSTMDAV